MLFSLLQQLFQEYTTITYKKICRGVKVCVNIEFMKFSLGIPSRSWQDRSTQMRTMIIIDRDIRGKTKQVNDYVCSHCVN